VGLEENSQGGPQVLARNPRPGGSALSGSFGEEREIALIGPAVTVALKAQGLFSWILFKRSWVPYLKMHSPEVAESFLTASKKQRTQCLSASEHTHTHTHTGTCRLTGLYAHFLILWKNSLSGNARNSRRNLKYSTKKFWAELEELPQIIRGRIIATSLAGVQTGALVASRPPPRYHSGWF